MHLRTRSREPHHGRRNETARSKEWPQPEISQGQERSERELRLALIDGSVKSKFAGGTLVVYGSDRLETQRGRITKIDLGQDSLKIKTYAKLEVELSFISHIRNSDCEFKERDGVLYISSWIGFFGNNSYAIAPRGVEIPSTFSK